MPESVLGALLEGFEGALHPRDFRGRFSVTDRVTYHHGLLGPMPATVTKVTKSRVEIRPEDPRARVTSMTHNQAAVKLEHMVNQPGSAHLRASSPGEARRLRDLERARNPLPAPRAAAKHKFQPGDQVQGTDRQGRPMGPPARIEDHNPDGSVTVVDSDGNRQTYTSERGLVKYTPRRISESANVGMLLEGFAEEVHPRGWHGRFRKGDKVRVELKGGKSIVGRVVRPADAQPESHAVIQPENGGPHVLAKVDSMKLDTPERSAREHAKRQLERGERIAGGGRVVAAAADAARTRAEILAKSPGAQRDLERHQAIGRGARRSAPRVRDVTAPRSVTRSRWLHPGVRESENPLDRLLEAFGAGPPETPAQSQVRGAQQVAKAQASIRAGWNASKHPRGRGGKFGYTTGGKRAKRGSSSSSRTLGVGARGALVGSIQRQLGISADGKYGPQTRSAVSRYQQQHHLVVDGVVGRQTLAALRGHTNPQRVKPGPIASKMATLKRHPATKKPGKPAAPVRIGGGIVV